jgi:hypothetical protein
MHTKSKKGENTKAQYRGEPRGQMNSKLNSQY